MTNKFHLDTKHIITSSIVLLLGVIFLLTNLTYAIALIFFIGSLLAIYLYLYKNDKLSISIFLVIFILVLIGGMSQNNILNIIYLGLSVFVINFFVIFKHYDMQNLMLSFIISFFTIELYLILNISSINIFAKSIIVSALFIAINQIIQQKNSKWNLNCYIYCIMFILVAIPIVIFY